MPSARSSPTMRCAPRSGSPGRRVESSPAARRANAATAGRESTQTDGRRAAVSSGTCAVGVLPVTGGGPGSPRPDLAGADPATQARTRRVECRATYRVPPDRSAWRLLGQAQAGSTHRILTPHTRRRVVSEATSSQKAAISPRSAARLPAPSSSSSFGPRRQSESPRLVEESKAARTSMSVARWDNALHDRRAATVRPSRPDFRTFPTAVPDH